MEEKEKIIQIEIERLRDFKSHPFHVIDDKEMSQLKESIKALGIINPLVVRPLMDGAYEIIAGHRRKYAAEQLGCLSSSERRERRVNYDNFENNGEIGIVSCLDHSCDDQLLYQTEYACI